MQSTDSLRLGKFATRSLIGLAASCGLALMLNGTAKAAESDIDTTAQESIVTNSESDVNVSQNSVQQESSTTATVASSSPTSSDPGKLTPATDSATASVEGSQTTLESAISSIANTPGVTEDNLVTPEAMLSTSPFTEKAEPVPSPVAEVRTQLTPTSSGWVMVSSPSDIAYVPQPAIIRAIAVTVAALPPVNTPVTPEGLIGQWSLGLVGVTLTTAFANILAALSGFEAFMTLLVLAVLLVGVAGMTYGSWLRRVGHVTAARSDLISLFFATPLLMDFIRVSPPERGPFLGVADINSYIINNSQKGAEL